MLTIDKVQADDIIDGLLGNNDLTASPEVWYGLHQIKKLPVTEIVRCGECKNKSFCPSKIDCGDGLYWYVRFCSRGERDERSTDADD